MYMGKGGMKDEKENFRIFKFTIIFLVGCTNKDVALSGTITTKEVEIEDVSSLEVYNINLKSGFSSFGAKIVCLNDDSKKEGSYNGFFRFNRKS